MGYLARRPSPFLSYFVESLWHFEGDAFSYARERILPSGKLQLLINLDEDQLRSYHGDGYVRLQRIRGAALCGAFTRHFAIDTAEQRAIVGVSFHPGGAFPFFTAPTDAVCDDHVELGDLWGRDGQLLRERLLEQPTPAARLQLLERLLLKLAVRPLQSNPALSYALDELEGGAAISAVVTRLGSTPRRFIREFSQAVGLTPKRWQRIRRFQRVLSSVESGADWAQVALDCGYFDQAHLIHDFHAFSGISPSRYHPAPSGPNHVPV
jgi:AraC-like DNA-binding protein